MLATGACSCSSTVDAIASARSLSTPTSYFSNSQKTKNYKLSLEAARKEAEEEVERITYTRKKQAKPKITKRDSFPNHLPREEIEIAIPGEFQQRIDSRELVLKRHPYTETLKHIPAKLVVLRYKQPVLAFTENLEKEILVDAEANLGDKSR